MKRFIGLVTLVFALAGHQVTVRVAAGQEVAPKKELTAGEVLDEMRQTFAAYSSIEYEFHWKMVHPTRQSNVSKYAQSGKFAYADGKFCSEYGIDSDEYQGNGCTAFDGNVYQRMQNGLTLLNVYGQVEGSVPYGALQPIMKPFENLFAPLTKPNRLDLETYRDQAVWNPLRDTAVLSEPRQVDGHPCAVVLIERMSNSRRAEQVKFELCAAKDLGCYPIQVHWHFEKMDGSQGWDSTRRMVEFADVKTARGRAIIPLRLELQAQDSTNTLQTTEIATIDKTTLKVDEPIPSERFNLRRLMPTAITYSGVTAEQKARFVNGP